MAIKKSELYSSLWKSCDKLCEVKNKLNAQILGSWEVNGDAKGEE